MISGNRTAESQALDERVAFPKTCVHECRTGSPEIPALANSYQNLLRMWAEG
ncbi:MAG: hypothetical protein ACREV1_08485 [Gammaproteobacteria bacterium]